MKYYIEDGVLISTMINVVLRYYIESAHQWLKNDWSGHIIMNSPENPFSITRWIQGTDGVIYIKWNGQIIRYTSQDTTPRWDSSICASSYLYSHRVKFTIYPMNMYTFGALFVVAIWRVLSWIFLYSLITACCTGHRASASLCIIVPVKHPLNIWVTHTYNSPQERQIPVVEHNEALR